MPGALHRTHLATFPGSGSRWLSEMAQFAAGLVTGELGVWLDRGHHYDNGALKEILTKGGKGDERLIYEKQLQFFLRIYNISRTLTAPSSAPCPQSATACWS